MRAADYVDAIRARRTALGISQAEAARRAGWQRQFWWDMEHGVRGVPTIDTIARAAEAVDMPLRLCPPVLDALDEKATQEKHRVSPFTASLLAKIRQMREALGLGHAEAAAMTGMTRGAYTNLEGGRAVQSVTVDRLDRVAQPFGLRVGLVAEHHAPLLELDVDEVEMLVQLVRWYHRQTQGRMPVALLSAWNKIRPERPALSRAA